MLLAVSQGPGIALKIVIIICVFLIGMTVFSYLNRVIEILPEGLIDDEDDEKEKSKEEIEEEKRAYKELKKKKREKLIKGRSQCPHCEHPWTVKESIPVFSWLTYKHKCNYCFERISARYSLIELLGGLLAIAPLIYYGLSVQTLLVFAVYAILATIAFIDMDTQYIPPELNIIIAVLGLISIIVLPGPTIAERLIGVVCISVPLLIITLIVPGAFGGGDIKMMAAVGVLLGWKGTVMAFLIGLLLGGIFGAFVLATKKLGRKEHFAFGPFLAIGIAISIYADCGTRMLNAYINYLMTSFHPY